ncbi:sulfotransferase [Pontimonas salivibrio]|uniref:Sulfotransferase n=1 Tax=Pontimonas salivibrio TaxID=1159327 RepID=A0A2L2BMZ2_9MICO|nr:hypothetical protein [Pontimonas salivibrio]AVG23033.1 sulfotransferase [Pontimonas salivibrio]
MRSKPSAVRGLTTLRLHLGLPKTATTTLQQYFARSVPAYVGPGAPNLPAGFFGRYRAAFLQQEPEWWASRESSRLREKLAASCEQALARSSDGELTLSWEGALTPGLFVGSDFPEVGGHPPGSRWVRHLAALVRAIAPKPVEIQVLLTVRRQPEWLASLYAQRSRRILGASQEDFEDQLRRLLARDQLPIPLDFARTVSELELLIPVRSVLVLPIESISTLGYRRALSAFLGVEEPSPDVFEEKLNQRRRDSVTWNLRDADERLRDSHSFRVVSGSDAVGSEPCIVLTESLRQEILERVKDSNSRLTANSPLPLSGY